MYAHSADSMAALAAGTRCTHAGITRTFCILVPVFWSGRLVSIHTTPRAGQPVIATNVCEVASGGLVGDRYAAGLGSFSRWPASYRAVTLISQEALNAAEAEYGVALQSGEHRRNLVVSGVPLADLKGIRFSIGEVILEGSRLCAPCKYLVRTTRQPEVFNALVGRGGLRARVIQPGTVRVGDAIKRVGEKAPRRRLPG